MKILKLTMLAFGFLLLNASSCKEENEETLPPETHDGENTFGCLVNGSIWRNANSDFMNPSLSASIYGDSLVIYANNTAYSKIQHIKLIINNKISITKYYFNSKIFSLIEHDDSTCKCIFQSDSLYQNENSNISITYLDTTKKILSGIFAFKSKLKENLPHTCDCDTSIINITEGRFDLHYTKY